MPVKSTGLTAAQVRSEFFERLRQFQGEETLWSRLVMTVNSTLPFESYRWLGQVPQMREWGSGRVSKGLSSESYDVINHKYEATLEVDRDEIDDDQTGQIRIRVGEFAGAVNDHNDYMISQLLINGASTGYIAYDGLTFFNDAHYVDTSDSNTYDNDFTTAIADKDSPTTAEFRTAFRAAISTMMAYKDIEGRPIGRSSDRFLVIVPPGVVWSAAREALTAQMLSNTTNVDTNLMADVALFPWLTDTDTFYVARIGRDTAPFVYQERTRLEFESMEQGSEHAFKEDKYLFGVRQRKALTYGLWYHCARHVFTTS